MILSINIIFSPTYKMSEQQLKSELLEKTQQLEQLTRDFEEFQETNNSNLKIIYSKTKSNLSK